MGVMLPVKQHTMGVIISTTVRGVGLYLESHASFPVWKASMSYAKIFDSTATALKTVDKWKKKDREHFINYKIIPV